MRKGIHKQYTVRIERNNLHAYNDAGIKYI